MKRFFKWLIGLFLLIVVIAAGVIYGGIHYAKSDKFKQDIITQVKQETGRDLSIDGDLNLSFYPWAGINLQNVSLSNPEGFSDKPFMKTDSLAVRIKTLPLLKQQFELDTLKIHGLELNLEKNKQGITNWADFAGDTDEKHSHDSEPPELAALILGGIDIKDSKVSWNDQSSGQVVNVNNITASTGELTFGDPVDLVASLNVESNQPAINSNVNLKGTLEYDLDNELYRAKPFNVTALMRGKKIPGGKTELTFDTGLVVDLKQQTATIESLNLNALDTQLQAELKASDIDSDPLVDGKFKLTGKSLAQLFKVLEVEPLATDLAKLKTSSFDISSSVNVDMEEQIVKVPDFIMKGLGTDINANVTASGLQSESPAAQGTLTAQGNNLPLLLEVVGQLQGDKNLIEFGHTLINTKQKSFDIASTFDLNPSVGKLNVTSLNAKALGLTVNGKMNSSNNNIDGNFTVNGEKLTDLLSAIGQADLAQVLKKLNLELGVKGKGDEISLSPFNLKATLSSKQIPNSPVDLIMIGDVNSNTNKQTASIKNLTIKGLGLDLMGNVNVTDLNTAANFNGDLSVAPFNLRSFLAKLNQPAPKTADKNVLKKFSIKTTLSGSKDSLKLSNLNMILDESELRGDVSVQNFSKPAINFGIGINQINADRYMPPANKAKATPETVAAGAATELPMDTLRSLNINGDVLIGSLVYSNIKMKDVKLSLKAKDGKLQFKPAKANLYEGNYSGDILLDATGKQPKLNMNTQFNDILIEPLLNDLTGEATLTGKGNVSLNLSSSGADVNALRNSLSGKGELDLVNGILKGVDIPKILHDVEIKIKNKDVLGLKNLPQGGETPFDSVNGTLDINSGVVSNEDLALLASGFNVAGKGMVMNLADQTWKYDLVVEATEQRLEQGEKTYNVGGERIPIRCRGKLADKNCIPDAGKIVSGFAAKQVERKLGDFLDKLSGKEKSEESTQTTETTPTESEATVPSKSSETESLTTEGEPTPPTEEEKDPVEQLKEKAVEELFKGLGF